MRGEQTRAEAVVRCPHCQSEAVVKDGRASNGKERFRCQQRARCGRAFLRPYGYPGCVPPVKRQIIERTLTGRGVRDLARVLGVGANTGLKELKESGRPLAGEHQRRPGVLSRGDQG